MGKHEFQWQWEAPHWLLVKQQQCHWWYDLSTQSIRSAAGSLMMYIPPRRSRLPRCWCKQWQLPSCRNIQAEASWAISQGHCRKYLENVTKRKLINSLSWNWEIDLACFLPQLHEEEDYDVDIKWNTIKHLMQSMSWTTDRTEKNEEQLTTGTWQEVDERNQLKNKLLSTKSPKLQEQYQKSYKNKDKEVK